ncbi:hypothetical protein [Aeromonas salmonicida]|uniref:hypothetical protein n=1 Tax=Aeromonas salmonicida TaxID=645 RepID=UPI003D26041B
MTHYFVNRLFLGAFFINASAMAASGAETAKNMTTNYNNVVENCGSATRPAFLCSGIMFRATNPDTMYNSWDPSPASVQSGGVSFSYLRRDSKFNKLAYGFTNGLVLYPYSFAPEDKNTDLDVLCAFPIDANTLERSDAGCGRNIISIEDNSIPCQEQGIEKAEDWANHYNGGYGDKHDEQCGFATSEASRFDGVSAFYQSIVAMQKIPEESINEQNELRLKTWDTTAENYPANFPIEAFFYIYKQVDLKEPIEKGLIGAQHDQESFFNKTGIWVPIIRISLPENYSKEAKFEYVGQDQSIPENL